MDVYHEIERAIYSAFALTPDEIAWTHAGTRSNWQAYEAEWWQEYCAPLIAAAQALSGRGYIELGLEGLACYRLRRLLGILSLYEQKSLPPPDRRVLPDKEPATT